MEENKPVKIHIETTYAKREIFKKVTELVGDNVSDVINDFMYRYCVSILVDNDHKIYDSSELELTDHDILKVFMPELYQNNSEDHK